jgi:hypothetical protein
LAFEADPPTFSRLPHPAKARAQASKRSDFMRRTLEEGIVVFQPHLPDEIEVARMITFLNKRDAVLKRLATG